MQITIPAGTDIRSAMDQLREFFLSTDNKRYHILQEDLTLKVDLKNAKGQPHPYNDELILLGDGNVYSVEDVFRQALNDAAQTILKSHISTKIDENLYILDHLKEKLGDQRYDQDSIKEGLGQLRANTSYWRFLKRALDEQLVNTVLLSKKEKDLEIYHYAMKIDPDCRFLSEPLIFGDDFSVQIDDCGCVRDKELAIHGLLTLAFHEGRIKVLKEDQMERRLNHISGLDKFE